jgi:cytochrome c peroxidase
MKRQFVALLCLAFGSCVAAGAGGPGVPSLPSTPYDYVQYAVTDLPDHFTAPPVASIDNTPANNPITNPGAALGRVLFYDARLSHNQSTSCASCHQQPTGFTDPEPLSTGFEGELTGRNSMGLSNARYYEPGSFFWDQRAATLEDQVLQPIQSPVEMGLTLPELVSRLEATQYYPVLFEQAFGDGQITTERVSQALSQFVRSMVSYQSRYDQAFVNGTPGNPDFASVLTPQELLGQSLYNGRGRCNDCHSGPLQTASRAHNIGLDPDNSADEGAGDGEFKSPSLRNIAERGTYMHDGRFSSLEEVIEFYNTGVQDNPNLDPIMRTGNGQVRRLNFAPEEVDALVAFLETLSDETFLNLDIFSNPFVDLPGDYNGDGVVDNQDYSTWRSAFGTSLAAADGNGDGIVDSADYPIWRDNLGSSWQTIGAAALPTSSTAVPEPASGVLLAAAVAAGVLARRRTTHRRR